MILYRKVYLMISYCSLFVLLFFFFFKQKTAYEMRISDWSSDVCSSDLLVRHLPSFFEGNVHHIELFLQPAHTEQSLCPAIRQPIERGPCLGMHHGALQGQDRYRGRQLHLLRLAANVP